MNKLIVTLLVLTVGVQILILLRQPNAAPAAQTRVAVEAIASRALSLSVKDAPKLGKSDAKVAIVEFADFECPFCRRHATTVFQELKEKFIDTGIASYYYLHLPLTRIHSQAIYAANAAECARGQGRFWEMHDLLFAGVGPTALAPDSIRKLAASLPIDVDAFDMCAGGVSERIAADAAQANRLNVQATPAFFVGRLTEEDTVALSSRINGAQPLEVFTAAVMEIQDQARRRAR